MSSNNPGSQSILPISIGLFDLYCADTDHDISLGVRAPLTNLGFSICEANVFATVLHVTGSAWVLESYLGWLTFLNAITQTYKTWYTFGMFYNVFWYHLVLKYYTTHENIGLCTTRWSMNKNILFFSIVFINRLQFCISEITLDRILSLNFLKNWDVQR